jgi:Amt family ammonium transporter
MVLAMHAGFAFLELGTVRKKNQVNALVKILVDFLGIDRGLFSGGLRRGLWHQLPGGRRATGRAQRLRPGQVLLPADVCCRHSGHHLRRHCRAGQVLAADRRHRGDRGWVYPVFEGITWNQQFGVQAWIKATTGHEFHDFAGSVVVHAVGGWLALPAVLLLGARANRYRKDGSISAHPPSNIPFLALGAWILTVGWFGFNVMSAQTIDKISGLVAVNSLMAMVGGTLVALAAGQERPGLHPQRAAGRAGGRVRRLRPDASAGRSGGPAAWPAPFLW